MSSLVAQGQAAVEDLFHYGVKGMKWGVRKADAPSSRRPSYSVDKDGRIAIEKGYELQRVFQSGKSEDGSQGSNYFAFTEKDKNVYVAMMAAGIDSRISIIRKLASDKVSTMIATEELRSPSRQEAFDILKQTIDEVGPVKGVKQFKGDFSDPKALLWYQDANTKFVLDRGSEFNKAYSANLRRKGYNILLDEMDSGFLSELPIIVLDGSKSLRPITVSDVRSEDVKTAKAFIKKVENQSVRSLEEFYGMRASS